MTVPHSIHNRVASEINLQATISAASAMTESVESHHPITCTSRLYLHEDGRFECEHTVVPPGDIRTGFAVDHSIAILLIECALDAFGS